MKTNYFLHDVDGALCVHRSICGIAENTISLDSFTIHKEKPNDIDYYLLATEVIQFHEDEIEFSFDGKTIEYPCYFLLLNIYGKMKTTSPI